MYNYLENMKMDVKEFFEGGDGEYIINKSASFDDFIQNCKDDLFTCDEITGNGTGSYTLDREQAKICVLENTDLLKDACLCFCLEAKDLLEHFCNDDWEYFDVTIRCYILSQAIDSMQDFLEEIYSK